MSNISISASLVNGDLAPFVDEGATCRNACTFVTGDDLRPPAQVVTIRVTTFSGRVVAVSIPNSDTGGARVDSRWEGCLASAVQDF